VQLLPEAQRHLGLPQNVLGPPLQKGMVSNTMHDLATTAEALSQLFHVAILHIGLHAF